MFPLLLSSHKYNHTYDPLLHSAGTQWQQLWARAIPHIFIYIYTHIHTYIHACMHACMHAYMHAYIHACIHTYMCTCVCVHIYIYIYTLLYMYREIEREREREGPQWSALVGRCSLGRLQVTERRARSVDDALVGGSLLQVERVERVTLSPPIKSLDFRGFDSSRLLILRGGNSHVR